jgi:hypothetical protein
LVFDWGVALDAVDWEHGGASVVGEEGFVEGTHIVWMVVIVAVSLLML